MLRSHPQGLVEQSLAPMTLETIQQLFYIKDILATRAMISVKHNPEIRRYVKRDRLWKHPLPWHKPARRGGLGGRRKGVWIQLFLDSTVWRVCRIDSDSFRKSVGFFSCFFRCSIDLSTNAASYGLYPPTSLLLARCSRLF
jgi:hypothetical protein